MTTFVSSEGRLPDQTSLAIVQQSPKQTFSAKDFVSCAPDPYIMVPDILTRRPNDPPEQDDNSGLQLGDQGYTDKNVRARRDASSISMCIRSVRCSPYQRRAVNLCLTCVA